jgi:exodeoxyribonuclease-5
MLHAMLESLALALPTSAAVRRIDPSDEARLIGAAVERALGEVDEERWRALPDSIVAAESRRLARLAGAWLTFERQRPAFELALHEHKMNFALAGIECAVRIDRVDHDDAGREIIIDYKSGSLPKRKDWFQDRMAKPQLPLYAVARAQSVVAAVVAAGINAEGVRCMGYGGEADLMPQVLDAGDETTPDGGQGWAAVLAYWRRSIEKLAMEYRQGDARVMPRDRGKTCSYCDFAALCRIAERPEAGAADADDEGEDEDVGDD